MYLIKTWHKWIPLYNFAAQICFSIWLKYSYSSWSIIFCSTKSSEDYQRTTDRRTPFPSKIKTKWQWQAFHNWMWSGRRTSSIVSIQIFIRILKYYRWNSERMTLSISNDTLLCIKSNSSNWRPSKSKH